MISCRIDSLSFCLPVDCFISKIFALSGVALKAPRGRWAHFYQPLRFDSTCLLCLCSGWLAPLNAKSNIEEEKQNVLRTSRISGRHRMACHTLGGPKRPDH